MIDILTGEVRRFRHPMSRHRLQVVVQDEGLVDQTHKESVDVNRIMNHYARTGVVPPDPRGRTPQYTDVSDLNRDLTGLIADSRKVQAEVDKATKRKKKAADEQLAKDKAAFEEWKKKQAELPVDIPSPEPK